MTDSPFIPGARVAVGEKFGQGVTEGFVEKVYKSGNFTLRGSKQQWKPWHSSYGGESRWSALETGDGYSRRRLDIWDAETDKEISAKVEAHRAGLRFRNLETKLRNVRHPTAAFCDALEAALALLQTEVRP